MEWKIGEIRQVNGEWYQCVEGNGCENCAFKGRKCYLEGDTDDPIGECCYDRRRDNKDVIFKKLEKVGEPFKSSNFDDRIVMLQSYKMLTIPYISGVVCYIHYDTNIIDIEIKQTKEDMEEEREYSEEEFKNNPRFQHHKPIEQVNNMKKMKPFNLEAAKQGKPVCTRDGRKARIICFDMNSFNNHIIVALITEENGTESIYSYTSEGKWKGTKTENDIMMLTEKKEGWINLWRHESGTVHPDGNVYSSKEEAVKIGSRDYNYVDTVKIEWEE